jgi:AraC-like DNA-binding protein
MLATPEILSDRPDAVDTGVDVVSEVLEAIRLTPVVFGRFEFGSPWSVRFPASGMLAFFVMARGSAWMEVAAADSGGSPTLVGLSAGDVCLLPRGPEHLLLDAERSGVAPVDATHLRCARVPGSTPIRLGGDGHVTALVAGAFRFGTAPQSALFDALPAVIHLDASRPESGPAVAATVQLILAESAAPGPGATLVLGRLADLLLIQVLRAQAATAGCGDPGLRAVSDPAIGAALRLMHGRLAEPWTVERLAREVAMSRSAFAARFATLVGEAPLQYLSRWRMTKAAQMLREGSASIDDVAAAVGYSNAAAFTRAFSRVEAMGPASYRREARSAP